MPWRELSCVLPRELAESVSEFLEARGAQAITFTEDGGEELFEPLPGETPLWRLTRLTALFELHTHTDALQAELTARFGDQLKDFQHQILADQPWERIWLEHFRPLNFGRLWICPSGQLPPASQATRLILDPGLAFGTGTHPTTSLCLNWLVSQDLSGKTILDYGCGSGILAIAALLLGAAHALACDIDPQALTATQTNARQNKVAERLSCCSPQALPAIAADIVLANILASLLIDLAPTLTAHTRIGGLLVLSGILEAQADQVRQAYAQHFHWQPPTLKDGWVRLVGLRKND